MQIKDFTSNKHKSINPQNHKNVVFHHYSLPAFDNGKAVSNELGSTILSNKFYLGKSVILFNKLNIKFKRIWNIKNPKENSICSSEFIPIIVDENICLQDYLYYFLCSEPLTNSLLGCVSGTSNSQQRIRPEDLLKQEIVLPSLDIQHHIVDILGSLDNSIENNEEKAKKIIELGLLLIQNNSVKQRELKPFIKFIKGKKPIENGSSLDVYLSIDAITTGNYTNAYIDGMIMANPFDILMVMDGASSGTVYSHQKGIVSSTLAKIETPNEINDYIFWFLLSLKDTIKSRNTGSAIPHANKDYIGSLMFDYEMATDDKLRKKLHTLREELIEIQIKNKEFKRLKELYLKKFFD